MLYNSITQGRWLGGRSESKATTRCCTHFTLSSAQFILCLFDLLFPAKVGPFQYVILTCITGQINLLLPKKILFTETRPARRETSFSSNEREIELFILFFSRDSFLQKFQNRVEKKLDVSTHTHTETDKQTDRRESAFVEYFREFVRSDLQSD